MGITETPGETRNGSASRVACPACDQPFPWPPTEPCARCGVDLTGPTATELFQLDREVGALQQRRQALVEELRAGWPRPEVDGRSGSAVGAAAGPAPPAPPELPAPAAGGSRLRPQTLLAAAGAVLLLAAVIVFIAVTWPTWPASAQVAFVATLTGVGAVAARAAAGRELPATADAIGVLTIAVAGYSLLAAHTEGLAGLDRVDTALWVAGVGAVTAVLARPFTTWAGLRDAPRRSAAVVAVAAAGSLLVWLADVVTLADPPLVLLAAAPTVAVALLAHGRWVLRPDDGARHAVPVVPGLLLLGAAVVTGVSELSAPSAVAAAVAAVVGLPLLVWSRQTRRSDPWTAAGAVLAVLWVAALATLALTDVTTAALGLAAPELVTFTVGSTVVLVAARLTPPDEHWRGPVLVATTAAAVPAALWTLVSWGTVAVVVAEALLTPLAGWPAAEALTATDLVLAVAAVGASAVLVEQLRRAWALPVVGAGGGLVLLAAAIAGAAAGVLPMAAPLALAAAAGAAAAVWWHRVPVRWPVVAVTYAAAVVVAAVDLELFALTTAVVAGHLLWVAARRAQPVAAAAGVGSGLAAVAATTQVLEWPTGVAALVVTALAGGVALWAQLVPAGRTWRHTPTDLVVVVTFWLATSAAVAAEAPTSVAVQLAVVAVVTAVHAARPGRGWAVWLSSLAASAAVWVLLADRAVDVVEAYTLPTAVALALAGAWRLHTTTSSSWLALGPACAVASLPTLAVLLGGPDPTRVLLLATGAVVVALAGHWRGLAAPLAAGTVVAMVTAVLQLHYWTAYRPRWVTFAVLGGVLIWASATYEAQRRRTRQVTAHLQRLR